MTPPSNFHGLEASPCPPSHEAFRNQRHFPPHRKQNNITTCIVQHDPCPLPLSLDADDNFVNAGDETNQQLRPLDRPKQVRKSQG
jgi:hypothetical protein